MTFSCLEEWSKSLARDITRLSGPEITADIPALTSKAQSEIDDELTALKERMRYLRTRRNSLSPVSSIPPEILGAIFDHHVQRTQLLHAPDAPAVLSWLNIGHVCRHWREVTLGTPELWATPFLVSLQATEEMLLRSKMVPLKLRTGRRYRIDCVQKTLTHIERLQEVSLPFFSHAFGSGTTHHCIAEFLDKLSSCSAPKLQSLFFEVEFKQTPRITIPTSFPAPNLRSLQIKHCDLSWVSPVLTGLTVLTIKKLSPECLPTLEELISALRRMPALHTLELEDALPTLPLQTTSLPRTPRAMNVRLPHLKQLCLAAKMLEVANVLARIELQESTTEVRLFCEGFSGNPNHQWNASLPIISRALKSCFKASPDKSRPVPRSMRLSSTGNCIRLHSSAVRNPPSWVGSKSGAYLDPDLLAENSVTLLFDFPDNMRRTILSDLQKVVPLGSIEAMYFHFFFPCWDGFWTDLLGRDATRNLAYMHIQGPCQALEELLKSLRSRKHSVSRRVDGRSQQGPIFAPVLSHLVLHDLEFGSSILNWLRPSDLLDVLIDRVNEGRGLDRLEFISTAGILARDVKLLREVVADVSWDEYESSDEDSDHDYDYDYDSDYDDPIDYGFYSDHGYSS
ncbi:uncharacterized protein BJ212DRAFT_1382548 [Suillus subaureus]|uniref:F-box domain-containing protein n=1 Tax=Suillus subaureus TaxID=48587 RepID=A0A9P7J8Q3_9AGAM|nr:uncharacterized protein BJ212DRAFT_1382548 [Suillus subaureus]KAG1808678.1 hypothetical protein BJ212DRAFT_1382548 [Suillus subaureus]